jgi:hypothetical protein
MEENATLRRLVVDRSGNACSKGLGSTFEHPFLTGGG